MGKSKGGGGGTSTPKIGIPPAIASSGPSSLSANVFQPLGTYGAEQMMGLGGLANWAANLATGGNVQTAGTLPANGLLPGGATQTFAPFTATGGTGGAGGAGTNFLSGLNAQQLGPFLANAVQNLINAQGATADLRVPAKTLLNQGTSELAAGNAFTNQGQLIRDQGQSYLNQGQSILGQGQSVFGQGQDLFNQLTTGTGLFPSQQAMITQAVQDQQTKIGQQLAAEGLGNSTLLQSLQGQAALSGAAAGGQLVQGNLQLAQGQETAGLGLGQLGISEQGVGIGEQQVGISQMQLGLGEQQLGAAATGAAAQIESAMYSQFSGIASQSASLQQNMWSEAQQGYGMMGNFLNGVLASFGYSLKTQEDVLQANEAAAGIQVQQEQLAAQAQAAQAQGFSSMLGGLGQLLGIGTGAGGGGGGLLGGLGGLLGSAGAGIGGAGAGAFGTVGGLASGAASAGAAGSLGALGSGAIGAIGSALGALFCEVARTVYGVDSPDWLLFRDWVLFKAPKSIRTLYVIHAFRISRWIKGRPRVCRLIRWVMNAVLYVDKITSKRA